MPEKELEKKELPEEKVLKYITDPKFKYKKYPEELEEETEMIPVTYRTKKRPPKDIPEVPTPESIALAFDKVKKVQGRLAEINAMIDKIRAEAEEQVNKLITEYKYEEISRKHVLALAKLAKIMKDVKGTAESDLFRFSEGTMLLYKEYEKVEEPRIKLVLDAAYERAAKDPKFDTFIEQLEELLEQLRDVKHYREIIEYHKPEKLGYLSFPISKKDISKSSQIDVEEIALKAIDIAKEYSSYIKDFVDDFEENITALGLA